MIKCKECWSSFISVVSHAQGWCNANQRSSKRLMNNIENNVSENKSNNVDILNMLSTR